MGIFGINSKSGRDIANILQSPYYRIPIDSSFQIRWGSTIYPNIHTLNTSEAIRTAVNKPLTRKILFENEVPVPKESKLNFPLVGRPQKHQGGKKFFYIENDYDLRRAEKKGAVYFSQFYKKQQEYRVHIGSGKVLLFSCKQGDKSKKVWNRKNGFSFRHMARSEWEWANELMEIQRMCKKALKSINLDFGAVDVMVSDIEDQKFVISEINTAPGLSPLGVQKYAAYFLKEGGGDGSEKRDLQQEI